MRALTLTQPWATLVATGAKQVETRSWQTRFRGTLAIHAAKGLGGLPGGTERDLAELCATEPFATALAAMHDPRAMATMLPRGAFVGLVELVDIVSTRSAKLDLLDDRERAFGNYAPGRFAWILERPRALSPPVGYPGSLGLRRLDGGLVELLRASEQVSQAAV